MSFDTVYREHRAGVRRWLARRCDWRVELDDVVQETFLQAWRIWDRRQTDNVRAWLLGIARRVFTHMRRALFRSGRIEEIQWSEWSDHRQQPANQEAVVMLMQLRSRFSHLGPAQAEALTAVADGHTPTEFATARGRSVASVTMALSLGRRRLREMTA